MKKFSVLVLSAFFLFSFAVVSAEAQTGRYWRGGDRGRNVSWSRRTIVRPVRVIRYGGYSSQRYYRPQRYYSYYPRTYRTYPRSYGYSSYPRYVRNSSPYYGRTYTRYRRPVRSGISVRFGW